MSKIIYIIKKIIRKVVKKVMLSIYFAMTKIFPVQQNVIMFESLIGRSYSSNPKVIYERMIERGIDKRYKIYWSFTDTSCEIIGNAKKVKRGGISYFYILAISGIWVSDSKFPPYLRKRKKNTCIQTWHGTPLKKLVLDMDMMDMAGSQDLDTYQRDFLKNSRMWDYLVSQNEYSTNIYRRAFDYKNKILEVGHPRNDVLINNNNEEAINKLKENLNLPKDKKIILYAPTWRDNEYYSVGKYKFEPDLDFDLLKSKLSDNYVFIVKYHYLIAENIDWTPYEGFIYDYDTSCDIADLYLVSDILITDYSSVMFDYSVLKRPMIFYCYDLEKYEKEVRGFYFELQDLAPGPIIKKGEDLANYLQKFSIEQYNQEYSDKYQDFNKKFNHEDDGRASDKIIDIIEGLKKNGE